MRLAFVVLLLIAALVGLAVFLTGPSGNEISEVSECNVDLELADWVSCAGEDRSFLQGIQWYYLAEGKPKALACDDSLSKPSDGEDCDTRYFRSWEEYSCEEAGLNSLDKCYRCQRTTGGGDTFEIVMAVDNECSRLVELRVANFPIDEVRALLDLGEEER